MIERLQKQQSSVNWIELNKREKMHKKLLTSLGRQDKLPQAFYNPNYKTQLIRDFSQRSSMSARSSRSTLSDKKCSSPNLKKFQSSFYAKQRK